MADTDSVPGDLVHAYLLDGDGGRRELDWDEIRGHWLSDDDAPVWVHLDHGDTSRRWLVDNAALPSGVAEALLARDTRPRLEPEDDGLLLILRGVNLNPDAQPDDMVSLRIWITEHRMVSVRLRRLMAVSDLREAFAAGRWPETISGLIAALIGRLCERMDPVIADLDDRLDALELEVETDLSKDIRLKLNDLRHTAIVLRRYLAPQRLALTRLVNDPPSWLAAADLRRIRQALDAQERYIENLDALRERAGVVQDDLASRLAEHLNNRMYFLSIITGLFLPLGFVTGLLGINVAGMPGSETPWAFAAVVALLIVIAAMQWLVFKLLRWV